MREIFSKYRWEIFNLLILILICLIIKCYGYNQLLFIKINSYHYLLQDNIWMMINLLAYSKYSILLLLLLILTYKYKKQEMLRVIILCISYFLVFYLLKKIFNEPRPYIVLPKDSFHFIPYFENYINSSYLSFPSGHVGQVAIFIFAILNLFRVNFLLKLFLFAFLFLVCAARICSGWHWPVDVVASILVAYILNIIIFGVNKRVNLNG
jgi:membrane-associated phospholipid phosphatase